MRIIFTLFALLFCHPTWSEQISQPAHKEQIKHSAPNSNAGGIPGKPKNPITASDGEVSSVISTASNPQATSSNEQPEKGEKNWLDRFFEDPIATFTGLLFFVTAGLWWATRGLVIGAEETSRRQLRAYIQVGMDKGPFIDDPQGPVAHFFIRNVGSTPAYNMSYWISIGRLNYPLKEDPPKPVGQIARSNIYLPPSVDFQIAAVAGESLTDEVITSIKDGTRYRMYVWGEVNFTDAFNEPRFVKFCLMQGGPEIPPGALFYAEHGNKAN